MLAFFTPYAPTVKVSFRLLLTSHATRYGAAVVKDAKSCEIESIWLSLITGCVLLYNSNNVGASAPPWRVLFFDFAQCHLKRETYCDYAILHVNVLLY